MQAGRQRMFAVRARVHRATVASITKTTVSSE